ncbi:hypothetical protein R3X27_07215 [Tropicimonas sp. TH_r6]|uniref:hypothetical protein n=1 Tax=Tropicimonas sp. TH_r6 TaxID=3082085 RepID=UPI002953EAE1|nr:hypothetical protein [Tropicimonas sp. TH_r6]MDV7142469.1 hypothetical protein [Tropicimonas sp. TH_r6]
MIPPITDITILNDINAERFRRDAYLLHASVNLPESPAVRAEIAAMLDNAERPAPEPARPARRIRDWFPRWVGWLRTMPMP